MLPQVIEAAPPAGQLFPDHVYNSGRHVYPLAMHIFPLQKDFPPTSMAFIGLTSSPAVLPTFEAEAAIAQIVFENPVALDIEKEKFRIMERRRYIELKTGGDEGMVGKAWHLFSTAEGFDHRKSLLRFPGVPRWMKIDPWFEELFYDRYMLRSEWEYVGLLFLFRDVGCGTNPALRVRKGCGQVR